MSAASITVASRTAERVRNKSAQCTPVPLPALGTQRIVQGNGTEVGSVISLLCPARHRLVGAELRCVTDTNSTHWEGETYCRPLSPYEDGGFRVAVLASIVSSAVILLMSAAFITCCLVDCIREEDRRDREHRDSDVDQNRRQEDNRSRYDHKGRNNNNNNKKLLPLWDEAAACRCHQQYPYSPAHTLGPAPLLSALPGHDYDQPVPHRNPESTRTSSPPPRYLRPPPGSDPVQVSAGPGSAWQNQNRNLNPAKEFSIRIISV